MKIKLKCTMLFVICILFVNGQTTEEKSLTEFNSGQVKKFSSKGEGKSSGLKIQMKYPNSWQSIEGEHPHVVRKFAQSDDYVLAMILIFKQDKAFSQSEINEMFTDDGIKSMLPESATFITSNVNLKIEGLKAGSIEFTNNSRRMDRQFYSHSLYFTFVYKQYLVYVQFSVANKIGESNMSVNTRYQKIKPLFVQMFNSIVIDNIWEK
jgi:hypothetical protein